ncbi:MAG TPA: hypothetical protein VHF26_15505 [Trebonia sp.]|nr:hypothetical protein [Trebonia sp.]
MMRTTGGGGSPSAKQLDDLAAQLREYAQQLRALVPQYAATLQPVVALDDAQTWNGPYPSQATAQIQGWQKSLTSGREALLSLAAQWDSLATQILQDAAKAAKTHS